MVRTMPHTPSIVGLAHIGIRVFDLERARAFYELLGFEFVVGPIGPEPVAILRHRSGVEINLVVNAASGEASNVLMDTGEKHPGYTHVAFRIEDLLAWQDRLTAAGIAITEGPVTFPNGHQSIFVRDPDRNVVELTRPPSSDGG